MKPLTFGDSFTSPSGKIQASIHPLVLLSIPDHFMRRNENQENVFGILLGTQKNEVVHIANSFSLPPSKLENSPFDTDFLKMMYHLHQKANPNEIMVGWYSTDQKIGEESGKIHESILKEMNNSEHPLIHLTFDTSFKDPKMGIKAYHLSPLSLPSSSNKTFFGSSFTSIDVHIETDPSEQTLVELLLKQKTEGESNFPLASELTLIQDFLTKSQHQLEGFSVYTNKVLKGEVEGNDEIGRRLSEAISSIMQLEPASYEKMITNNIQDLLMVIYLINLTKTQLAISEKLQIGSI